MKNIIIIILHSFRSLFQSGLINVKRLRVEDRLSDANNQPIEVRVLRQILLYEGMREMKGHLSEIVLLFALDR